MQNNSRDGPETLFLSMKNVGLLAYYVRKNRMTLRTGNNRNRIKRRVRTWKITLWNQ